MARLPLHPLLLLLTLLLATSCLGRRRYRQQQNTIPEQEKNYYEILGLEAGPETPDSKIKQAYRHLSKKLHPDLNPSDEAKNKYQDVQEAYGVLSDRKRRKVYDMMGHEGLKQLEQASQRGGRAQDPFSNFFGFGGGDSGPERGPDIQMTIRVTLDDVYNGAEHTVPLAKQKLKNWEVVRKCMKCKARPPTVQNVQIGPGMVMRQEVPPDCRGECGPRGAVTRKQVNMEVKIEEGVPEGQTLTYELEADEYPGQAPRGCEVCGGDLAAQDVHSGWQQPAHEARHLPLGGPGGVREDLHPHGRARVRGCAQRPDSPRVQDDPDRGGDAQAPRAQREG
eukprot:Sspe_Gene.75329::Locus_47074_Transcript_1_1_Confidence_1.000_Length_1198::g.75329::m.75329